MHKAVGQVPYVNVVALEIFFEEPLLIFVKQPGLALYSLLKKPIKILKKFLSAKTIYSGS